MITNVLKYISQLTLQTDLMYFDKLLNYRPNHLKVQLYMYIIVFINVYT